jgi:hypothetical protein
MQDLKDELIFQYIQNWDTNKSSRHYFKAFMSMNPKYKKAIFFNIFAKKFIFNFKDTFKKAVEDTSDVFEEKMLGEPYAIACYFKV